MSDDFLAQLAARYRTRAAAALESLEALRAAGPPGEEIRALAHRLAGTAGTLGFMPLSEAARVVEEALMDRLPCPPETLDRLATELRAVAEGG